MVGHHRESVWFTVVVTVLSLVGAAVMLALLVLFNAPGSVLLAAGLAALPVGPVVACFLWLDRYEPEPPKLLVSGLLWGAFAATAGAILVQEFADLFGPMSDVAAIAVAAPVVEEATKGAFLVMLLWWRRSELDGILDGIVYAGMVGVGFAYVENIIYLAGAHMGAEEMGMSGSGAVTLTFIVRCIASPFAHPLFTAFLGIGVGIAVGARTPAARVVAVTVGYALAVGTHALWNFSAVALPEGFIVVYVVLMAPLFLLAIGFAVWLRTLERQMLHAALRDAARRGLLPATDIGWLVDLRARRLARQHALARGGKAAEEAMEEYQQAAVELGFLHHRYLRGTPPPDFAARGASFVVRLNAVRPLIAFPGQVVPSR